MLQFVDLKFTDCDMKKFIKFAGQRMASVKMMLLVVAMSSFSVIYAQEKHDVIGKLIEAKSNQPIPFASVSLLRASDPTLIHGATSDEKGIFKISAVVKGHYMLSVSFVGYKTVSKDLYIISKGDIDVGIIYLNEAVIDIKETVIVGERSKARSEKDKTTFFVTKKMLDVSNNGTDVLKLIPGVQVDIMQNVSLEGSRNIMILVNGKERDRSFISQLIPKQIAKIEVVSVPTSNYDGNVTGAINIILKDDRDAGISGQVNAEIPTSGSEVYLFPTYSLNYGIRKLNLYTSYNGEMSYFDITEQTNRRVSANTGINEITSTQNVRQKDWSHRFHYGFDYFLNAHNLVNFYGFYNPYSNEHDGTANTQLTGRIHKNWQAKKEDTDVNISNFYSLYFKHLFGKPGREITLDVSNYHLKAENSTEYIVAGADNSTTMQTNTVKPRQNSATIKVDYITPVGDKLNFSTGVKAKFQKMRDKHSPGFKYDEKIVAAYGTGSYKNTLYDLSTGLRVEESVSDLQNSFNKTSFSFLPYATFKYKLTPKQNIQLSWNRSVNRPNIYQLNPNISIDDPYSVRKGNSSLKPEFRSSLFIEHSIQFKSNYFATRLFYNRITDAINELTFINDTSAFESQVQNMGTIKQYGVQLSGALKLGIATFNPYFRLFDISTASNRLAKQYGVGNRHHPTFESGLSAIVSFKNDIALSFVFQYATKRNNIQDNYYCDALYFLSLEKTFNQKIKFGIVSIIPFTKSFIYRGTDIDTPNFSSHYQGIMHMSLPILFKISYQFSSGKNRDKINCAKEEIDVVTKKGF